MEGPLEQSSGNRAVQGENENVLDSFSLLSPSFPAAVLQFWFLCDIIGIAVSCPNRLVNYSQEIARLLALEEATLSTDLQQGYALKSLTGIWWHQHESCSRFRDGGILVL